MSTAATLQVPHAPEPDFLFRLEVGFSPTAPRAERRASGVSCFPTIKQSLEKTTNVLGGRRGGSQGRYPGVIEEAYLSLKARRPL